MGCGGCKWVVVGVSGLWWVLLGCGGCYWVVVGVRGLWWV